jgi:hypothetical protein
MIHRISADRRRYGARPLIALQVGVLLTGNECARHHGSGGSRAAIGWAPNDARRTRNWASERAGAGATDPNPRPSGVPGRARRNAAFAGCRRGAGDHEQDGALDAGLLGVGSGPLGGGARRTSASSAPAPRRWLIFARTSSPRGGSWAIGRIEVSHWTTVPRGVRVVGPPWRCTYNRVTRQCNCRRRRRGAAQPGSPACS